MTTKIPWPAGGATLKILCFRYDIEPQELLDELAQKDIEDTSVKMVQEWETGEKRPSRSTLLSILADILHIQEISRINELLELWDYAPITNEEAAKHNLDIHTATTVPQKVRWKSGRGGGTPGIETYSDHGEGFIPWDELKYQFENKLIHYLGQHLPQGNYTVDTAPGQGTNHWHIFIFDQNKTPVGNLWIGAGPETGMVWDGLIRAGNGKVSDGSAKTWQVFERWSDGSYRRVKTLLAHY